MKDISELNPHGYKTNEQVDKNLAVLYQRLIELQDAAGMDFTITSGLRSEAQQNELILRGKTNAKASKHLTGFAADIYDPDQVLQKYLTENPKVLENIGLWCEDFSHTPNWVHCQAIPPRSGKRFFIP